MNIWKWDELGVKKNIPNKHFSSNLLALQMQLKTIMDDVGGERALAFLDTLSQLGESEQRIALEYFTTVIKRVLCGDVRLESDIDKANKEFENCLYGDIIDSFNEEAIQKGRFEVLKGGKMTQKKSNILDLKRYVQNKTMQ